MKLSACKITVVVAICNVGPYLTECFESLVNQTFDDVEILAIVVEESSDESFEITQEYAQKYASYFTMLTIPKGTVGDVRNHGMQHASGEFVFFVDGDDYLDLTALEKFYKQAQYSGADVVASRIGRIDNQTGEKGINKAKANMYPTTVLQNPQVLNSAKVYATNKLYKLSVIADNDLYYPTGRWFEDMARTYSILLCAAKIDFVNEPLYWYRVNREGSVTQKNDETIFQALEAVRDFVNFYKSRDAFDACYSVLASLSRRHLTHRFPRLYPSNSGKVRRKFLRQAYRLLDKNFPDWRKQVFPRFTKDPIVLAQTNPRFAWLLSFVPYKYFRSWRKFMANEWLQAGLLIVLGGKNKKQREQFFLKARTSSVKSGLVFFEVQQGLGLRGDLSRLYRKMREQGAGYDTRFVWALDSEDTRDDVAEIYSSHTTTHFVARGSKEYIQALCTAEYVFFDSTPPVYYRKLANQKVYTLLDMSHIKEVVGAKKFNLHARGELRKRALMSDALLVDRVSYSEPLLRDMLGNCIFEESTIVKARFTGRKEESDPVVQDFFDEYFQESRQSGKKLVLNAPMWTGESRSYAWGGSDQFAPLLQKMHESYNEEEFFHAILPHSATYGNLPEALKSSKNILPAYLDETEVARVADVLLTNRLDIKLVEKDGGQDSLRSSDVCELADSILSGKLAVESDKKGSSHPRVALYAGKINKRQLENTNVLQQIDTLIESGIDVSLIINARLSAYAKSILHSYDGKIELLYDVQEDMLYGGEGRHWHRLIRIAATPSSHSWLAIKRGLEWEYESRFGRRKFTHYLDLAANDPLMVGMFVAQANIEGSVYSPKNLDQHMAKERKIFERNHFAVSKCRAIELLAGLSTTACKFHRSSSRKNLVRSTNL